MGCGWAYDSKAKLLTPYYPTKRLIKLLIFSLSLEFFLREAEAGFQVRTCIGLKCAYPRWTQIRGKGFECRHAVPCQSPSRDKGKYVYTYRGRFLAQADSSEAAAGPCVLLHRRLGTEGATGVLRKGCEHE